MSIYKFLVQGYGRQRLLPSCSNPRSRLLYPCPIKRSSHSGHREEAVPSHGFGPVNRNSSSSDSSSAPNVLQPSCSPCVIFACRRTGEKSGEEASGFHSIKV